MNMVIVDDNEAMLLSFITLQIEQGREHIEHLTKDINLSEDSLKVLDLMLLHVEQDIPILPAGAHAKMALILLEWKKKMVKMVEDSGDMLE